MFEYTKNAINNILFGDWMEYNLCPSEKIGPLLIYKKIYVYFS